MDASPATAHLFIVNPLSGRSLMTLFSTHPPLEDRIARDQRTRHPESSRRKRYRVLSGRRQVALCSENDQQLRAGCVC